VKAETGAQQTNRARLPLAPSRRRALLTIHIVVAVGLLGDSAGFLAIAIRAATTDDPRLATSSYELLRMFSYVFGIPLSFATLITGVGLGLTSRWGVLRYPWTVGKLLLIVSVILAGALVIDGALDDPTNGGNAETALIAAASWDVIALMTATALAVYKPGRGRRRALSPQTRQPSGAGAGDELSTSHRSQRHDNRKGFMSVEVTTHEPRDSRSADLARRLRHRAQYQPHYEEAR
jgi:uncharacterized membrane protein